VRHAGGGPSQVTSWFLYGAGGTDSGTSGLPEGSSNWLGHRNWRKGFYAGTENAAASYQKNGTRSEDCRIHRPKFPSGKSSH